MSMVDLDIVDVIKKGSFLAYFQLQKRDIMLMIVN